MSGKDASESPKRRAIVSAAADLFAARGYGAVSMDAIARAADVSKATLYAHFESKDRLFATIIQAACRDDIVPEESLTERGGSAREALTAIGGRILRFFLTGRSLAIHRLVVAESVRFPELGRAYYDNGPVALRDALGAWIAGRTDLAAPDPGLAAEQFVGLLRTGLYVRASLGLAAAPADAEVDAAIDAAVSLFLRAHARRGDGSPGDG